MSATQRARWVSFGAGVVLTVLASLAGALAAFWVLSSAYRRVRFGVLLDHPEQLLGLSALAWAGLYTWVSALTLGLGWATAELVGGHAPLRARPALAATGVVGVGMLAVVGAWALSARVWAQAMAKVAYDARPTEPWAHLALTLLAFTICSPALVTVFAALSARSSAQRGALAPPSADPAPTLRG